jgi:hypothetical protein
VRRRSSKEETTGRGEARCSGKRRKVRSVQLQATYVWKELDESNGARNNRAMRSDAKRPEQPPVHLTRLDWAKLPCFLFF